MSTFKAEGYETKELELAGWPARVASYKLGERWACKVDNVSPGAVIARGEGASREEAEADAVGRAERRLRLTRRFEVLSEKMNEINEELTKIKAEL